MHRCGSPLHCCGVKTLSYYSSVGQNVERVVQNSIIFGPFGGIFSCPEDELQTVLGANLHTVKDDHNFIYGRFPTVPGCKQAIRSGELQGCDNTTNERGQV
jgi:hypothetical protein